MTTNSPPNGTDDDSLPQATGLDDALEETIRVSPGRRADSEAPGSPTDGEVTYISAGSDPWGIADDDEPVAPPASATGDDGDVLSWVEPLPDLSAGEAPNVPATARQTFVAPSDTDAASVSHPPTAAPEGRADRGGLHAAALSLLPTDADVARASGPGKATRGFAGLLNRVSGGLFRLRPGAVEARERQEADRRLETESDIRTATWSRAVSVLVANRKGGVGKTPTSLILGGVLASIRGGSVAVLEVTDDPGALGYRAEGSAPRGLGDLVRDVDSITSAGQLSGYTAPQTSFASVIASTGYRPHLTGDDVIAVSGLIDEFYSVRVMDSGNQPTSSAFLGAVEVADVLVVPVLNAGDAVLDAVALLDHLRSIGPKGAALADGAIVVRLTDSRPESAHVVSRIDGILSDARPAHVVHVPYDAHIAERGQITVSSLAEPTLRAFTEIAERVVLRLQAIVP